MNQIAIDFVKQHEGCKLTAYQDQASVWTIGFGATGPDIKHGLVWTQKQADDRLIFDLNHAEQDVLSLVKVHLSQQSLAALISFVFNLGKGALAKSDALAFINESEHLLGAKALLNWDHIGSVENKGLLIRRIEEAALYLKGA